MGTSQCTMHRIVHYYILLIYILNLLACAQFEFLCKMEIYGIFSCIEKLGVNLQFYIYYYKNVYFII